MTSMTMNSAPRAGSLPRKSLAQQLDRLDQLLDGLSDGIQAAVVDAVKDAVGLAVQTALREVLTHPDVLARLAPTPVPVAVPAPTPAAVPTARRASWSGRLWATVRSGASWLRSRWSDFVGETRAVVKHTGRTVFRITRVLWTLVRYNIRAVVLALSVGMAAGAACYFAGPIVAAAVSGVVAAILAGLARLLAPFVGMLATDNEA